MAVFGYFGHQSLSYSLGFTFAVVENSRFAVGILTLFIVSPDIYIFPVLAAISLFSVVGCFCNHLPALSSSSLRSKAPNLPLEFKCCLSQFQRYKYSRFQRPFLIVRHYWNRARWWSKTSDLTLEFSMIRLILSNM